MAKKLRTLATRLIFVVLIVHAVLLPLLFYGLLYIVKQSHEQMFVDNIRTFSRFVADNFDEDGKLVSEQRGIELLDGTTLCSKCIFSELWEDDERLYKSTLNNESLVFQEDFAFGDHSDDIYFLSVPLLLPERQIILRLGFDELSTINEINQAYLSGLLVLSVYFLLSLAWAIWMSIRLTKPLSILQQSSRIIASGHFSDRLSVDSNILEIDGLAKDLEFMRSKLFQTNQDLEQEIKQRFAEEKRRKLVEAQLLHSQKLEMIGTLAGGIAHEFNNILLPILLYTELAKDELDEDDPVAGDLDRVLSSAERAKNLVQQLLTFSRQDQDQKDKISSVDLTRVINEALELLRAITPATITFRQHINAYDGYILGEEGQIQQLMVNLCNNAVKAINRDIGIVEIKLSVFETNEGDSREQINLTPGKYIHLSVSDTGQGMEKEILERIFEPFFTTGEIGEGCGLGLSVVHGIVSSHGGDIRAFSTPGKGTIFHVYLPLLSRPNG